MKLRFALLLSLMFTLQALWSQSDSSLFISEENWKALSEDADYTETFVDQKSEDPAPEAPSAGLLNVSFGYFKYVIYFLVLALIAFLSYRLFRHSKDNASLSTTTVIPVSVNEMEEKIHEIDLDALLQQALRNNNFQLALRINFLIIIKLLSQRGDISWAKEKTNWEYYSELKDKLMADRFREVIRSFETFWYGEYPITPLQYQKAEAACHDLQKRLSVHE